MFSTCIYHYKWVIYSNRICLKKWNFLDLVCSVHIFTITTGLSYRNRISLKKWHFPDLVCTVHVLTITTGLSYRNTSRLKKWHFPDVVCSVHVVTIITGLGYGNRICLKKWHFPNLVCAYKFEFSNNKFSGKISSSRKVIFFWSSMLSTCSNHYVYDWVNKWVEPARKGKGKKMGILPFTYWALFTTNIFFALLEIVMCL